MKHLGYHTDHVLQARVVNLAVVHYLHFTRSLRKVSAIYGTSPASLSRWVRKHASNAPQAATKRRKPRDAALAVHHAVRDAVASDAFTTLGDIVASLKKQKIFASKSTVHRHLKSCGFSRKRAVRRFSQKEPTASDAAQFLSAVRDAGEVISIDEASVVLERQPLYGYTLEGTRALFRGRKSI
jgi:transposase